MTKFRFFALITALILVVALVFSLNNSINNQRASSSLTVQLPTALPALGTSSAPQSIKIKASDGLQIVGQYYPSSLSGRAAPAALLLHQNGSDKSQWTALIPALQGADYAVLAVDQRGFGETGGAADRSLWDGDTASMMAWLRSQPGIAPDQVVLIGTSIGANLSLRLCATDSACKVVVALSPGLNFLDVPTEDSMKALKGKSILLVAGQLDSQSSDAVKQLALDASTDNNLMTRLYANSSQHGRDLFQNGDLNSIILQWLSSNNRTGS